jgi:hypothetical protein
MPSAFYVLDPEVPGGLGENTELIYRDGDYALVERLHFEFGAGRYDDDLFTTHPVYLVTQPLADALRRTTLTGFSLNSDIELTADDNVKELEPDWQIPQAEWLQVTGTPGSDDFGLTADARLVVSEAALDVLRTGAIDHCEVAPFDD